MSIGNEIKTRREKAGITQEDLARVACLSRSAIARYESEWAIPSLAALVRIADALGTTPAAILEAGTSTKEARA